MSYKVANACSDRLFGGPVRKQIIMFLADKASDDGSGIFCSKGTIARHTELGGSTVKRVISEFVAEGILVETGNRPCTNGYTVIYRIDIDAVEALEPVTDPELRTPPKVNRARRGPGTGPRTDGVPRPERDPNHPKTIHKPLTRERTREAAVENDVIRILTAYPQDRRRDEVTCHQLISDALRHVSAQDLFSAVLAHAARTTGFTRSKVSFSDNWFRREEWRRYVEEDREQSKCNDRALATVVANAVEWVKAKSPLCKHVSSSIALAAIEGGLLTKQQVAAAGIQL
jgi:hypothetical protein